MLTLIKLLLIISITTSITPAQKKLTFLSPDKMSRATIYNFNKKSRILESKIILLDHSGRALFDKSFVSKDHEHGLGVVQAEWTTNSQFFVFGMLSSGGHQPWHFFTYIYSVSTGKLISLDEAVEPVTSRFKLFPPDSLEAVGFKTNMDHKAKFGIHLSNLIPDP